MLHKHGRFGGVIVDMRIVSIQESDMIEKANSKCCILNIQHQSLPLVIACAINIVQYSIFLHNLWEGCVCLYTKGVHYLLNDH